MNTHSNRLAREFQRLYGFTDALPPGRPGGVRALVLEVARPAEWRPLAAVWKGVQADLGLPAPAIAANGTDGLQLWFSLAEPLDAEQAHHFLDTLRLRYLADVPLHRVTMTAAPVPAVLPAVLHAQQPTGGRWSVFVAANLAPLFEESPWLDGPPTEEGQAELLARLRSTAAAPWAAAQSLLELQPQPHSQALPQPVPGEPATAAGTTPRPQVATAARVAAHTAAQGFLLTVMGDATAPLVLRVEAAKALLADAPPRSAA